MTRGATLSFLFWLLATALAGAGLSALSSSAPPLKGELHWRNGETLQGEVVEATDKTVTWKTPLFEQPLVIGWDALRRIDQAGAPLLTDATFSVVLRDGSHLYGELVAITPETISMHSDRHGDLALDRTAVVSLRRLQSERLLFAGPLGEVGWTSVENSAPNQPADANGQPAPNQAAAPLIPGLEAVPGAAPAPTLPAVRAGAGGSVYFPFWNRSAALDLNLPEQIDVEFRVHAAGRPDFRLTLGTQPENRIRLETWDNEIVLVSGAEFLSVSKIAAGEHEVALRICWNAESRKGTVFTPGGQLLAAWRAPQDTGGATHPITLQNKGRDLSLDFLRVRDWGGGPPSEYDPAQPHVELSDGRVLPGEVTATTGDSIHLRAPAPGGEQSLPLAFVDAIVLSSAALPPTTAHATCTFADGTLLFGDIVGMKAGRASLRVAFAQAPISTRLEDLRRLSLTPAADAAPEPPLAEMDQIVLDQTILHGHLAGASDGRPAWLAVGSTLPAVPALGVTTEITRPSSAAGPPPPSQALFYTTTGDILPGRLRSLDRSGVEIDSTIVEHTKLPAERLEAIQFNPSAQKAVSNFDDPAWRVLKGAPEAVQRHGNSLTLEPGASIGHPWALQSDELNFTYQYRNFSALRLRLFCAGLDPSTSTNLLIVHMGDRVSAGLEQEEGRFESDAQHQVSNGPVTVHLAFQEKQIVLSLNGTVVETFPFDPARRAGAGLILEPASVWGNGVTSISLSDFSAPAAPGRPWLPEVTSEAKTQALTIPRFRKDDPPRQALLAANGDLLRGEIEAATRTDFQVRSGLETLRVPIDRVRAAIWLQKPLAGDAKAAEESETQKLLDQRIGRRARYHGAALRLLISVLQAEAPTLRFQLPPARNEPQVMMNFNGQTIGEALDQICTLFDLRYRVGANGFILLEAGGRQGAGLVQKVYWLHADAFPADIADVRDLLTAKGLAFPGGASVAWQPRAHELLVVNTPANHEQLAALLQSDYGGILGSPTHWLQLTSGGRLGLIVDKFEGDALLGHHPDYGLCKIPLADIYTLRTVMPLPTAAMKALADWHLVYAPEPVIPSAGGESSADLGQPAKPFQLSLLDGTKFDLAQQTGKITVLDFWATWCGPCIKSLPGLIESVSIFPADRVQLIGIDQGEPTEQVRHFVETRNWPLTVALDLDQKIGRLYGVEGIPHTVIVGPDGKIAWVKTGYSPDGEKEAAEVIKKLLAPTP